jgi:hypothetical protein
VITCSFLGETLTLYGSGNSRSVIELHTFLVTLIRQFEFALPDDAPKIESRRRGLGIIMPVPVVGGEEHEGARLPLKVIPLKDE